MTANKRLGARWKGIVLNWNDFDQYSEEKKLYWLSDIEASILIAFCEYVSWKSRWITAPPNAVDLRSEMEYDLMTPVDLCALVAECIRNPDSPANQAVRDIANSGNGYPPNQTPSEEQRNKDLLTGTNPECDLSKLYGQCLYIVTTTNRLITDFMERFEVGANFTEVLGALSELPAINETGAATMNAYAQYLLEAIPENYASQYNAAIERELACGLFCIAKPTCSLTIEQIANYFQGKLGSSLTVGDLLVDIVAALAGIPMSGSYVVYSLYTLCWQGLRLTNIALDGVGDEFLSIALQAGAGEPSDDWMLYCDDCSVPAGLYYDFTAGSQGFTISSPPTPARGEYAASVGFRTTTNAIGTTAVLFARTMTSGATISKVRLEYDCTVSPQPNPLSRVLRAGTVQGTIKNTSFAVGVSTAELTITIAVTSGQSVGFDLNLDDVAPNTGGIGVIRKAWVYFSGAIPTTANWGGQEFYE